MEFKIKSHDIDNGFKIIKVNGLVPNELQGYFSTEKKAQEVIDAYMLKVIAKKEALEKEIEKEKEKTVKKAPSKKAPSKKITKK